MDILFPQNPMGLPVAKAMTSEDGECVEWKYNLVLDGPAEVWLLGLEHTMRVVLRDVSCSYMVVDILVDSYLG